jgi:hypothetical protein
MTSSGETARAYNKFLEKKTGKFEIQTVRSLALMQESVFPGNFSPRMELQ